MKKVFFSAGTLMLALAGAFTVFAEEQSPTAEPSAQAAAPESATYAAKWEAAEVSDTEEELISTAEKIGERIRTAKKLRADIESAQYLPVYTSPEIKKLRDEENRLSESLAEIRAKIREAMTRIPEIAEKINEETDVRKEIADLRDKMKTLKDIIRKKRQNKSM